VSSAGAITKHWALVRFGLAGVAGSPSTGPRRAVGRDPADAPARASAAQQSSRDGTNAPGEPAALAWSKAQQPHRNEPRNQG